ncbi:MAG: J domain-containing protein [Elusimicrobia bacterium]|nr:J domain-containing protein [Elusimicrobiota bacterium]
MPDPYETLGLPRGASAAEIKEAFRVIARRIPPERRLADPEAEKTYKKLKEAYDLLCDPDVRKAAGPQPARDYVEPQREEEPELKPGEEFNFRRFVGWAGLAIGGAAVVVGFLNAYAETGGFLSRAFGLRPILYEDERMGWFMIMIAGIMLSFWSAGRFMITDEEYRKEWMRGIRRGRLRRPI